MEAIILAGGLGTRLRSVISDMPKSMAPISGHPFLSLLLYNLSLKGFKRAILSVGYKYADIKRFFGKSFHELDLHYVIENEPLGTGGAIRSSLKHINSDHAHVFNGDTFIDLDFDSIESLWKTHKKTIVSITEVPDTYRYGKVIESNGLILDFVEKGNRGRGLINCGAYVFGKNELNRCTPSLIICSYRLER